jgi:hypothetical protein
MSVFGVSLCDVVIIAEILDNPREWIMIYFFLQHHPMKHERQTFYYLHSHLYVFYEI